MTQQTLSPVLGAIKLTAKDRLQHGLASTRGRGAYAQLLETAAQRLGFRDWNTLNAAANASLRMADMRPGMAVRGAYMGHGFKARIRDIKLQDDGDYEICVDLDEAIDVVVFDGFSSWRKRITTVVDVHGVSRERLSNGAALMAFLA